MMQNESRHRFRKAVVVTIALLSLLVRMPAARAVVIVSATSTPRVPGAPVEQTTRIRQSATLANEVVEYVLSMDYTLDPPSKVLNTGLVNIVMPSPSRANWYGHPNHRDHGFLEWHFDDLNLATVEPQLKVIRDSGRDGMVEFTWDTSKVRAWVRLALVSGSDKLLMFGGYEPKEPVERSWLKLITFPGIQTREHRDRAATTVEGTVTTGALELDLSKQRWILYEDVTEGSPGSGSSGLLIATPEAFRSVRVPSVPGYMMVTELELALETRRFAVALYEYPEVPDCEVTRRHFAASADREAEQIGRMSASGLDQPLPALPLSSERRDEIAAGRKEIVAHYEEEHFSRPYERWTADPRPLDFRWANPLGEQGPVRTTLLTTRARAWTTMELARRLEMEVRHVYFDTDDALSNHWVYAYRKQTGVSAIPYEAGKQKLLAEVRRPGVEVIASLKLSPRALPPIVMCNIIDQVANGKGLLLVDFPEQIAEDHWPEQLFGKADPELAAQVLSGLDWRAFPGLADEGDDRVQGVTPVRAWRTGKGRVIALTIRERKIEHKYGGLVPAHDRIDGLDGILDRALALAGRAVLAVAGREPVCRIGVRAVRGRLAVDLGPAPSHAERLRGGSLLMRVQDEHDRILVRRTVDLPLEDGWVRLPRLPAGCAHYIDVVVRDAEGTALGYAFTTVPEKAEPAIREVKLSPTRQPEGALTPMVALPEGGILTLAATVVPDPRHPAGESELVFEVRDAFDRLVGRQAAIVPAGRSRVQARIALPRPVTPCHVLDLKLRRGSDVLAVARRRFAVQVDYALDEYAGLLWTYCGRTPVLGRASRLCYEWGADLQDLKISDAQAGGWNDGVTAREYHFASYSGLRLVPYPTRITGRADSNHHRVPGMRDAEHLQSQRQRLTIAARQAAPFSPVAYTLGDENYLCEGEGECGHAPETVAQFRRWLQGRYGSIEKLNEAWASELTGFQQVEQPMLREEAAQQKVSIASWIDLRLFLETEFALLHERCQDFVRAQDPAARVGWDGPHMGGWKGGGDMRKMTRSLQLNQVYVGQWWLGELVRSFKRPDALTGTWGNALADVESGWRAHAWDGLLSGHNSVWWWSLWGRDYIPFNPDLSPSPFARWWFEELRAATAGPGRLLLGAERDDSGVAVLYSPPDMFAAEVLGLMREELALASFSDHQGEHTGLLRAVRDHGAQYRHVYYADMEAEGLSSADYPILFLPLAACISDQTATALGEYVEAGGTLVADGRGGLLTGPGRIRETRALDALFGVRGKAGLDGLTQMQVESTVRVQGTIPGIAERVDLALEPFEGVVLEPGLSVTIGTALGEANGAPVVVVNQVGKGRAITLNLALSEVNSAREEAEAHPLETIVGALLKSAGVEPPCQLKTDTGRRPRCIQQVRWRDGRAHYLAVMQDILTKVGEQEVQLTLPESAWVYDVRAGGPVGAGPVDTWDVRLQRGPPLLYSLLPYRVVGIDAKAPDTATAGQQVKVGARIRVSEGAAGRHVVRMNVYAPSADRPHRQYSQNVEAPGGVATAVIPFALNDRAGTWAVELRDVSSGVNTRRQLSLRGSLPVR